MSSYVFLRTSPPAQPACVPTASEQSHTRDMLVLLRMDGCMRERPADLPCARESSV